MVMVVKVGINGFGRIGRVVLRACLENSDVKISAINDPAIEIEYICYLIKFDSTHGKLRSNITHTENEITINDVQIKVFHQKVPNSIPWYTAGVQYVVEASGMFTSLEKASGHLACDGVKRVIVTAPSVDVPMIILGVNDDTINAEHRVMSCGSSTLYCLAPIVKVLEDNFGIESGFVTSIHAMTPSLKPLDGLCLRGKHWRDHRGIHQNIIPAATGACKALGKIIPDVRDKLKGLGFRVPIVNVSVLDLTIQLNNGTTLQEIVSNVEKVSKSSMQNIIKISNEEAVSSDFIGDSHSCILDVDSSLQLKSNFLKLVCWYENEYSYACRVIDSILFSEKQFVESEFRSKMTYVRPKQFKKQDMIQQTECCLKESPLARKITDFTKMYVNSNIISPSSENSRSKGKILPRPVLPKKQLTIHNTSARSSFINDREPKMTTELFKIWNDEINPTTRQNRSSIFQGTDALETQNTKQSDCIKAQERLQVVNKEFSKMVDITEDLLRKSHKSNVQIKCLSEPSKEMLCNESVGDSKEKSKELDVELDKCEIVFMSKVADLSEDGKISDCDDKNKIPNGYCIKGATSNNACDKENSNKSTEVKEFIKSETQDLITSRSQDTSKITEVSPYKRLNTVSYTVQSNNTKNSVHKIESCNPRSNFKSQVTKTINSFLDGLSKNYRYSTGVMHKEKLSTEGNENEKFILKREEIISDEEKNNNENTDNQQFCRKEDMTEQEVKNYDEKNKTITLKSTGNKGKEKQSQLKTKHNELTEHHTEKFTNNKDKSGSEKIKYTPFTRKPVTRNIIGVTNNKGNLIDDNNKCKQFTVNIDKMANNEEKPNDEQNKNKQLTFSSKIAHCNENLSGGLIANKKSLMNNARMTSSIKEPEEPEKTEIKQFTSNYANMAHSTENSSLMIQDIIRENKTYILNVPEGGSRCSHRGVKLSDEKIERKQHTLSNAELTYDLENRTKIMKSKDILINLNGANNTNNQEKESDEKTKYEQFPLYSAKINQSELKLIHKKINNNPSASVAEMIKNEQLNIKNKRNKQFTINIAEITRNVKTLSTKYKTENNAVIPYEYNSETITDKKSNNNVNSDEIITTSLHTENISYDGGATPFTEHKLNVKKSITKNYTEFELKTNTSILPKDKIKEENTLCTTLLRERLKKNFVSQNKVTLDDKKSRNKSKINNTITEKNISLKIIKDNNENKQNKVKLRYTTKPEQESQETFTIIPFVTSGENIFHEDSPNTIEGGSEWESGFTKTAHYSSKYMINTNLIDEEIKIHNINSEQENISVTENHLIDNSSETVSSKVEPDTCMGMEIKNHFYKIMNIPKSTLNKTNNLSGYPSPEDMSIYSGEVNLYKQDVYDKLDSASATDSDNSFQVDERKSQILYINDLTSSLEDIARLDKICRIIEISDDLSDKLFSSLETDAANSDRSKKKWSFSDLCEKINLDEFCNKVFGTSTPSV